MKKMVIVFAVAIGFAACNQNGVSKSTPTQDSTNVVADSTVVADTTKIADTTEVVK